jgi:hypothetical protein
MTLIFIISIITFDIGIAFLMYIPVVFATVAPDDGGQRSAKDEDEQLTNASYTTSASRAHSITFSLSPSYASACHGAAPSGFYSRDCT